MSKSVGTVEWAQETRGILRFQDRLRLFGQLARELPQIRSELLPRLGRVPRLRKIREPDPVLRTTIVDEAAALCREASTQELWWLYPHSYRTFRFAQLFAQRGRIKFDPEILWVAAMLHDVGFKDEPLAAVAPGVPCFAVRGAAKAGDLADQFDWPHASRRRLCEAITLHVNARVSKHHNAEGHLLNLGSALDVAGMRYGRIYSAAMKKVIEESPRGDFQPTIRRAWHDEAERAPGCRAPFLKHVGLGCLMRTTPFRHTDTTPSSASVGGNVPR